VLALLVERNGGVQFLEAQGLLLGVMPQGGVRTGEAEIAPDSALVLYTDGVIEAGRDPVAGEQALIRAVTAWARGGCVWTAGELQERAVGGRPRADDAAMLVLRFPSAGRLNVALAASPENAQRHAYRDGPGEVRLAARRVGDQVVASVRDGGIWLGDAPVVTAGHGLDIMEKLAPGTQIRRGPRGSTVSFRFPLPQPVEA